VAPGEGKRRILIIEDELEMQVFLTNLLEGAGFEAQVAGGREEGLETIAALKPGLVILNATLSGEAGVQLYRHLRREELFRDIPVVMMSTINRKTFFQCHPCREPGKNEGGIPAPEAYIEKPPEAEVLLKTIFGILEQPGTPGSRSAIKER